MNCLRKLICLVVVTIVTTSFAVADVPVFEVSGKISDKLSGKYIKEARIYLERDGEIVSETYSRGDGTFFIKIPEGDMGKGNIKVKVRKPGYRTEILLAIPDSKNTFEVQLERTKAVPIMTPKRSSTGKYIIV